MKKCLRFALFVVGALVGAPIHEMKAQSALAPRPQPTHQLAQRNDWWVYETPRYDIRIGFQMGQNNSIQSVQSSPHNVFQVTQIASRSNTAKVTQVGPYNSSNVISIVNTSLSFAPSAP